MDMYSNPIYLRSPVWLQNGLLSARACVRGALREGNAFRRELKDVMNSQWLDAKALQRLQLERLQRTVSHAAAHVPYYRESFAAAGFSPNDLVTLDDVWRIPILSKREVFDAGDRLLADNVFGPRIRNSTGGTTGMSMGVVRDLHSITREQAFIWRQLAWIGVKPGERRAWIRNDRIVPSTTTKPPFWRFSRPDNMLMMSSYHLSEHSVESYIEALEAFDPVVGMAYPSPLLLMARYMIGAGRPYRGKSLRGFFTSSETVTDEHRRLVENAFGCRIFDQYGSTERVTFIGTCERGNYHVNSDYAFTELVPQEDGTCEVVGTSFDNRVMPWIRYRLGDSVVPADPGYVCPCGRAFPVVEKIVGRICDYLLTPDGRHVFMISNVLDHIPNMLEAQIRQESALDVRILVVPLPGTKFDVADAITKARSQLGDGMRIRVEQVARVPRTANGKLRVVVRDFQ